MSNTIDLSTLQTDAYVNIPYPRGLRIAVEEAVSNWQKFCDLPETTRRSVPYSSKGNGVGYELKSGEGKSADRKANFDYTTGGREEIKTISNKLNIPELAMFVESLERLHALIAPEVVVLASHIEHSFGIDGFAAKVLSSKDKFFLRFIHYPEGAHIGEEIAVPHADNSCFTLHLFESADGLERLGLDRAWKPMHVSAGETVAIPNMQLQLLSKGKLKACIHRVVATEKTVMTGRLSAVCFVGVTDAPEYDKARFGRLQELEEKFRAEHGHGGFNYDLPHEQFLPYFK